MVSPPGHGHRPHDLLWLADERALTINGPRPGWVTAPWLAVAPVVVRRAACTDPRQVPVGIRGAARSERCAAQVPADRVLRAMTPEAIAHGAPARIVARGSSLPCLRAFDRLKTSLATLPLAWGVTGGVGFTLASGFDVLRADSDLDLLLRVPCATQADLLHEVAALLRDLPARVDVQVETLAGAFALTEWLRTGGPVLLKTSRGPAWAGDPWSGIDAAMPAA